MDGQLGVAIVSGAVSVVSAFGSILLKDYLDRRRMSAPALAATLAADPASRPVRASTSGFSAFPLMVAALAIGGGVALHRLHPPAMVSKAIVGSLFAAPFVLLWRRLRGPPELRNLRYQLEVLALWAGFAVGIAQTGQPIVTCVIGWLASLVIGGGVLLLVGQSRR